MTDAEIELVTDPELAETARAEVRARLMRNGQPPEWAETGVVFQDQYVVIHRDPVRFPGGGLGTYLRIELAHPRPGVAVLPRLGGKTVLLRHFRHATRTWHWEIPRGFCDGSETLEAAAHRELMEEIGASAVRIFHLGRFHPDTGLMSHSIELFLAEIDALGALERREGISTAQVVADEELLDWIQQGLIDDGITLTAVSLALATAARSPKNGRGLREWITKLTGKLPGS